MAEVHYQRRIPFYSLRLFLFIAAGLWAMVTFGSWAEFGDPLPVAALWGPGAAARILALFAVLLFGLRAGEGVRVRVTDTELQLGWRRVPIEQVTSVSAVPARQVGRSILSYRVGQRKLGWWSKLVSYDTKAAVVVRDGRRERRSWWLIDVDDPDRFIEAVRTAQANARRGKRDG